jgi:hypothetical protein
MLPIAENLGIGCQAITGVVSVKMICSAEDQPGVAHYVFMLIFLRYLFHYVDRMIVSALLPYLKVEWGFTNAVRLYRSTRSDTGKTKTVIINVTIEANQPHWVIVANPQRCLIFC